MLCRRILLTSPGLTAASVHHSVTHPPPSQPGSSPMPVSTYYSFVPKAPTWTNSGFFCSFFLVPPLEPLAEGADDACGDPLRCSAGKSAGGRGRMPLVDSFLPSFLPTATTATTATALPLYNKHELCNATLTPPPPPPPPPPLATTRYYTRVQTH